MKDLRVFYWALMVMLLNESNKPIKNKLNLCIMRPTLQCRVPFRAHMIDVLFWMYYVKSMTVFAEVTGSSSISACLLCELSAVSATPGIFS